MTPLNEIGEMLCVGGPMAGHFIAVDGVELLVPVALSPRVNNRFGLDHPAGHYDDWGVWHWGPPLNIETHVYEVTRVLMHAGVKK